MPSFPNRKNHQTLSLRSRLQSSIIPFLILNSPDSGDWTFIAFVSYFSLVSQKRGDLEKQCRALSRDQDREVFRPHYQANVGYTMEWLLLFGWLLDDHPFSPRSGFPLYLALRTSVTNVAGLRTMMQQSPRALVSESYLLEFYLLTSERYFVRQTA